MANEHIGRLQKVGLGKESTSGTAVAATAWIPKVSGVFRPEFGKAKDTSAYGNIDALRDSQTVKQVTMLELEAIVRDVYIGHLLMAAFGTDTLTIRMAMGSLSGTFVRGETVSQATSGATGVVEDVDGSTHIYISVTSGTFTSASNTVTGGTSGATMTPTFDNTLRTHLFERLNSNTHPSYTLYGVDPVGTYRAAYGMLDTLDLECTVGDFLKFSSSWMAKKEASSSGTPSFTEENEFLATHAAVYFADTLEGLDSATAVSVERVKLTIQKNLEDYQAFGDSDVASIHNKQFSVVGDLTALFNSTTLKDYVVNSTKKCMRIEFVNDDVTIGSASNPFLRFDLPSVAFESWERDSDNDALTRQTLGFEAEFEVDSSETIHALLQNSQTTAY